MFTGLPKEMIEYQLMLRANNDTGFYAQNKAEFEQYVKLPMMALAKALAGGLNEIDANMITVPIKVVSRIRRDTRFTRDKSPYRTNMWLGYAGDIPQKSERFGLYFDISPDGSSFGAGFYGDNKPWIDALRRAMVADPDRMLEVISTLPNDFTLAGDDYKKLRVPEGLPDALKSWYIRRSFYFERTIPLDVALNNPDLPEMLLNGYRALGRFYRYMYAVRGG